MTRCERSGSDETTSDCSSISNSLLISSSIEFASSLSCSSVVGVPVREGARNTPMRSKNDCLLVSSSPAGGVAVEVVEERIPRSHRLTRQKPNALVRRRNQPAVMRKKESHSVAAVLVRNPEGPSAPPSPELLQDVTSPVEASVVAFSRSRLALNHSSASCALPNVGHASAGSWLRPGPLMSSNRARRPKPHCINVTPRPALLP